MGSGDANSVAGEKAVAEPATIIPPPTIKPAPRISGTVAPDISLFLNEITAIASSFSPRMNHLACDELTSQRMGK